MINISDFAQGDVLAVLYNNSKPQGMGFLISTSKDMTKIEADELLKKQTYFDYVQGRVMKVDLSSDIEFDPWLYDRDNGVGAAQKAINLLQKKQNDFL